MTTTTKEELEKRCSRIAQEINTGQYDFDSEYSDHEEPCADDYLSDMLDCRYTINLSKEYMGARILVVCGGPNIWINTLEKCVEGYWGRDVVKRYYCNDKIGLCDYMAQL